MNLVVEHKDIGGNTTNKVFHLSRLAFIKHMAIAGQGYSPHPQKLFRTIGMLFHYAYYLQKKSFYKNRFSIPPDELSDPTEKGQFSNLTGKAIADFLSKRIDNSIFTINYEAALRIKGMPVSGQRPDLIAYTQDAIFAIEAKGYSKGEGDMDAHKKQSSTGDIAVNYTVACVSYNLYDRVSCKYHDPFNSNVEYDSITLRELTKIYYSSLAKFLNQKYFRNHMAKLNGEKFYVIDLRNKEYEKSLQESSSFSPFWPLELFDLYKPKLILPINIVEYATNGITKQTNPFKFQNEQNNIYIDYDRVGLQIEE